MIAHFRCWNNIVQLPYVWFLLTHTSCYSIHCVLDNLRTNMYLLVHTVHNPVLWLKSDLPVGHSMWYHDMTKIVAFTTWRHLFTVSGYDWTILHYQIQWNLEILKSSSLHWRLYYSLRVFGIDTTETMFSGVLQTLLYSLTLYIII